jgi:hypothetical protein
MSNVIDLEYFRLKKDISRERSPVDEEITERIQSIRNRLKSIEDTLRKLKGEVL